MNTQLNNAREQIDQIDRDIIGLVGRFNIKAKPHPVKTPDYSGLDVETSINTLQDLLTDAMDMSELNHFTQDEVKAELKRHLKERFEAVSSVVFEKQEQGIKLSYNAQRHQEVIDNAGKYAEECGYQKHFSETIMRIIADNFVEMQDPYLNNQKGPFAKYADMQNEEGRDKEAEALNYAN